MTRLLPILLLAGFFTGACAQPPREPAPPAADTLPAGFRLVGTPEVVEVGLSPEAAYRQMLARLTTLRADARGRREDILVTFEERAYYLTGRDGGRRVYRLPEGLALSIDSPYLLIGADLTLQVLGESVKLDEEGDPILLVARYGGAGGGVEESRLIVKGGSDLRSIPRSGGR